MRTIEDYIAFLPNKECSPSGRETGPSEVEEGIVIWDKNNVTRSQQSLNCKITAHQRALGACKVGDRDAEVEGFLGAPDQV